MTHKYCLTFSMQKKSKRREIEDGWFYECREKKIPFITVYQKAGNSDIHHDYINLPVDLDDVFSRTHNGSLAGDIISLFRRFYAQAPSSAMSVETCGAVTWFRCVPNDIAPALAAELFDLVSQYCRAHTRPGQ